jgi:hypothetical protein
MKRDVDYRHIEAILEGVLGAPEVGIRSVDFPAPNDVKSFDGHVYPLPGADNERYLHVDVFDARTPPPLGEMLDVDGGLQLLITEYTRNFGGVDSARVTLFTRTFDLWAEMRAALASGGRT